MNLILTQKCNKNCSYCFALEDRKNSICCSDMDLDFAKRLVDDAAENNEPLKILGGEPTLYPHLKELLDYIKAKEMGPNLITNLMFDEDMANMIKEQLEQNPKMEILANFTELDIKNRYEIFKKNFEILNNDTRVYLSYTIDNKKPIKYHINYLTDHIEPFKKIKHIRISIMFPTEQSKYSILNDKEYGNTIYQVCKFLVNQGFICHFDCIILPCLFSNLEFIKLVHNKQVIFFVNCNRPVMDVFPNHECRYCYPCSEISTVYTDFETTFKELIYKYNEAYKRPDTCTKCNKCPGPCLALLEKVAQ